MHTFTILIPCYNAEQYIKRCLLSIIEQKEFIQFNVKIICANDGSTDNTLDVINSVAKSFPNQIKVVSDQNCGLSLTRQKLINLCDTEYFIHVDADDYLTSNSLRLYFDAMSHSNDLFIFRSYHQKENSRKRLNYVNKFIKKTDMNVNYYISHNMFYIWNIVISTNFYRSASFKYDHVKNIGEDYICLAYLFTLAKNIGWSREATYYYMKHENTYTYKNAIQRIDDVVQNFVLFLNITNNIVSPTINILRNNFLYFTIINTLLMIKTNKKIINKTMRSDLIKDLQHVINDNKLSLDKKDLCFWKKITWWFMKGRSIIS